MIRPVTTPQMPSRCRTSSGVGWVFAKASGQDHIRIGNRSPARLPPAELWHCERGSIAQKVHRVTYCIGVMLDKGMIFASDSRTNAGVDNFAKFCKMTVFERRDNRVVVLLSSGNLYAAHHPPGNDFPISTLFLGRARTNHSRAVDHPPTDTMPKRHVSSSPVSR